MAAAVATRANASNLSDPQYGYDAVLSVTHVSLNDNVRAFVLNNTHATQKLYWTADSKGKMVLSTYAQVFAMENLDPLAFSDANPPAANIRQSLWSKGFRFATSSTLGTNTKTPPSAVPQDMVSFTTDGQYVIMTPIWRDFTLVALTADFQWHSYTQDPALPWSFAPLAEISTYKHNATSNGQSPTLNASTFYVPTLALDLARPNRGFNINVRSTMPTNINDQLSDLAGDILAAAFQNSSLPIASIQSKTTPWSVALASYGYMINRYVDNSGRPITAPTPVQQDATTLNYLCCTARKQLPAPRPFSWNWIEANQVNPFHGVFALNRNTFRDYIESQITAQVKQACVAMNPVCSPGVGAGPLFSVTFTTGQSPDVTKKNATTQVLYYGWSNDKTGSAGQASLQISSGYQCSVDFEDDQIIIRQRSYGTMNVHLPGSSTQTGVFIDKQYLDTYTITVNQFGGLSWSVAHQTINNTPDQGTNPTLKLLQEHGNFDFPVALANAMTGFKPMAWGSYSANSPAPNFILPAGTTFSCANARFSDHQDLIVNLMYAS